MKKFRKQNFSNAKVGDKVFEVLTGEWTKIIDTNAVGSYPIKTNYNTYTLEGLFRIDSVTPLLLDYNPFEEGEGERVIEVKQNEGQTWVKRVLISVKNGKAVCWTSAETLQESEKEISITSWGMWREVPVEHEVTIDELKQVYAESKAIDLENIKVKQDENR